MQRNTHSSINILALLTFVAQGRAQRDAQSNALAVQNTKQKRVLAELDEQLQDLYTARDAANAQATHNEILFEASSNDWELRDIALVLTVDGELHAVKRSNGQWVWSLHDSSAGSANVISQPLVSSRSTYGSTVSATSEEVNASRGMSTQASYLSGKPEEEDEVYILEPTAGGSIFVYNRSKHTTTKLPLSISELVNLSPFTFPGDDSRMFVSQKTTSLVGIDLASGKLAGVFGPEAGWCEWQSNKSGMMDAECEEGIQSRPRDLLYLGRTGMFGRTEVRCR